MTSQFNLYTHPVLSRRRSRSEIHVPLNIPHGNVYESLPGLWRRSNSRRSRHHLRPIRQPKAKERRTEMDNRISIVPSFNDPMLAKSFHLDHQTKLYKYTLCPFFMTLFFLPKYLSADFTIFFRLIYLRGNLFI